MDIPQTFCPPLLFLFLVLLVSSPLFSGDMYLWMRLDDRLPPSSMWLLGVRPEEIVVLVVAFGSTLLLLLRNGGCFRACSGWGNSGGRD